MKIFHRALAYGDLIRKYKETFSYVWKNRSKFKTGLFNSVEAEFLPAALSLQERPISVTIKWTARILILLIFSTLIWSIVGKVDIVVNASGKIIPRGRIKSIASVDVASVTALHVVEGQHVKSGEILIELDSSEIDAEKDKAQTERIDAILQMERSRALIMAIDRIQAPAIYSIEKLNKSYHIQIPKEKWAEEQAHVEGIFNDFVAKLNRVDGDIKKYARALELATERANDYKELFKNHDIPYHAWLEKEESRGNLFSQNEDAKNQRASLVAETKKVAFDQYSEGSKLSNSYNSDAIRSAAHSKLLILRSPVDGVIQQLNVHSVGSVVPAAQTLMQIIPSGDNIIVEAFIENKDIGFIQEGQFAQVKVDAFDFGTYGTISGTVKQVAHDAISDEKKGWIYPVNIGMMKSSMLIENKEINLSPGMSVNVEIRTGRRRIIEYILSPLVKHGHEALHER
ncbi:HlyD family type I secretion periplasmic adaptor subunit [Duganella vulcania]|uniref:Membrane fusion protein (MFP) family protein n=1 Tax=Duganella vulcania TaxID=2692166 RepID=A0A845GR93_9BURK|nr:HlyD family type I secretion periplasmic adaptor subunit [Duganella vulcania]MYM95197.1 HlyD family type I secretion periplasmic adaptor subunit [Duganella vulcania]